MSSLALVLGTAGVAVGLVSGPAGTARAAGGGAPVFVQQAWAHAGGVGSLSVAPTGAVANGDRLVVEVGVWSVGAATAGSVSDSVGNSYTELTHFTGSDGTEMSVWTAQVTAGGGTIPTLTAKPTGSADVGVAMLEYSGVSSVGGVSAVDVQGHATGTTSGAGTVAAGATAPTTAAGELALGFYADSGFGDALTAGSGFTSRVNVSNVTDMELLAEEQLTGAAGASPDATFGTGASTVWLAATVVLKAEGTGAATVPGAPTGVAATAGNGSATVTWTAPADGGSPLTSYTVTPYADGVAGTPTVVTGTPPAASATVSGLSDTVPYTFTVSAANAVGAGPVSQPSNTAVPDPVPNGQFGALQTWPIVAVHSAVLDDGKVLVWDGWQNPQPTHVFDPATGTFSTATPTDSLFCSGLAKLPDGRVLVAGGYGASSTGMLGIADTNIFNPATNTWTRAADMHLKRWYPDLTELPDGRYVALSGNSTDANTWSDTPELYDPAANTWTLLSGISTPQVHEVEYPFSYLAPNGKIFTIGPEEDVSYWLDATAQTWTSVGASGLKNGSAVMYRPGKILYSGGAASVETTSSSITAAATIDLTAPTPAWQPVAPMHYPRIYHTLTTLADGRVLAVGGEATSDQSVVTSGTLPAEIWDPATNQWTTIDSIAAARNYHSTAVLLPDGRVLIAGGGHPTGLSDPGQYSAQIYSPSYLFNGARPTITTGPGSAVYGGTMTVATPDAASIAAVNLVSFGSDTHQSDMDQHFVPLAFTAGSGTLSVRAPSGGAIAPPGDYMLFIVNKAGVPSVAAMVHLSAAPPTVPGAPTAVTATPGSSSATLSWSAPASDGGAPITSYTVTPSANGSALTPTTVSGNPPATSATISGLTNGTSYTFTVAATNSAGTGPASAPSNAVVPTNVASPVFVQQASVHQASGTTAAVALGAPVTVGNRLIVQVGVWNTSSATATKVTDSAGDTYTELTHFTAADNTEMSVWSAPITAGGGTKPTVSATVSSSADVGVTALEYSGLSTAAGLAAVDVQSHNTGTTSAAGGTVSAGATTAVAAAGELAVGFYADSGFGDNLTAGSGFTQRANVSPTSDMELLAEDQVPVAGATAAATFGTGGSTVWLAATVVFKHG